MDCSLKSADNLAALFGSKKEIPDEQLVPTLIYSGTRNATLQVMKVVNQALWCAILVSSIKYGKKDQFLYIIGIKLDILLHNPTLQGPKLIVTHQKHWVLHT
jgi:hypothetical protein